MNLNRKVLLMPASWERALVCIVPYFNLLGKYAWLHLKYRELQGKCFWYRHIVKYHRRIYGYNGLQWS